MPRVSGTSQIWKKCVGSVFDLSNARVAKVRGEFEAKINTLLGSPAGRAYVAHRAADNVTFEKTLHFNSADGIPSVLRLRDFALRFMGR